MKKWLCAAGLGLAIVASANAQAEDKVAVVNVMSVLQQMPQREAIVKQLEAEFKTRATELKTLEKKAQDNAQKLQKNGSSMKAADRAKLEKDIQSFQEKYQAFTQDTRRRESEEMNKLVVKIQDAAKTVAQKEKYTVIVRSEAVFYSAPANDITEAVIKQVK